MAYRIKPTRVPQFMGEELIAHGKSMGRRTRPAIAPIVSAGERSFIHGSKSIGVGAANKLHKVPKHFHVSRFHEGNFH